MKPRACQAPSPTPKDHQLLQSLLNSLTAQQLQTHSSPDQLFFYTDILLRVCRKVSQICNNSPLALQQFCAYLIDKLISYELEIAPDVDAELLRRLRVENNIVVYFTQICFRLALLGYLCKVGAQNRRKEWKQKLDQLIKEARFEFMFNHHESLATCLTTFIDALSQFCHQFTFYQKLISLFTKYDLEFVAEHVRAKMANLKDSWKSAVNKNRIQFRVSGSGENQGRRENKQQGEKTGEKGKTAEKVSNIRKGARKIACQQQRQKLPTPEQNLRKRISDFRDLQRKRLSEHIQSSKKRTIFQSRRYTVKLTQSQSQSQSQDEQQSICISEGEGKDEQQNYRHVEEIIMQEIKEESVQVQTVMETQYRNGKEIKKVRETIQVRGTREVSKERNLSALSSRKKEIKQPQWEQKEYNDEGFMAPGTPPRKPQPPPQN